MPLERTELSSPIMTRLREGTAPAHARVDALVDLPRLNLERYRRLLSGLRAAHRAVERELQGHGCTLARFGYDLNERSKLCWLDEDLSVIGHWDEGGPSQCAAYRLADPAAAFGAVYVLEGATLGGSVIARHVMPALSLTEDAGCRFFMGYGARTGEFWRGTAAAIAAHAAEAGGDSPARMVSAAQQTFGLLEQELRARGLA